MNILMTALSIAFGLCGAAVIGLRYALSPAGGMTLESLEDAAKRPDVAKLADLGAFHGAGITPALTLLIQMGIAVCSALLGLSAKNPLLIITLFLYGREVFALIALFLRTRLDEQENAGLERTLRTFQAVYNQSKSCRETIGRLATELTGVWQSAMARLYRGLGRGGDPKAPYDVFAAAFPSNRHVKLWAQLLYHNDVYGGELQGSLNQIIGDVMRDGLEKGKNQSETGATVVVIMLLNVCVTSLAVYNLLALPDVSGVLIHSNTGRLLLAAAALCLALSLRFARRITES